MAIRDWLKRDEIAAFASNELAVAAAIRWQSALSPSPGPC
jgi:hypothetical protein